jgi:hypothetical protein
MAILGQRQDAGPATWTGPGSSTFRLWTSAAKPDPCVVLYEYAISANVAVERSTQSTIVPSGSVPPCRRRAAIVSTARNSRACRARARSVSDSRCSRNRRSRWRMYSSRRSTQRCFADQIQLCLDRLDLPPRHGFGKGLGGFQEAAAVEHVPVDAEGGVGFHAFAWLAFPGLDGVQDGGRVAVLAQGLGEVSLSRSSAPASTLGELTGREGPSRCRRGGTFT